MIRIFDLILDFSKETHLKIQIQSNKKLLPPCLLKGVTMRQLFRISVLFVLGRLLYKTVAQQCGSEVSIFGWMLQGHIYSTMLAHLPHTCVQVCREDDRCQSFNWVISLLKCEFSNRTKEARPEDFISDPDRFYYKRDRNRGEKQFPIHYK